MKNLSNRRWTLAEKIAFRFATVFFFIHILGSYAFEFPPLSLVIDGLVRTVLQSPNATNEVNGSGDSAYSWAGFILQMSITAFATLVWSLLDRRRINYDRTYFFVEIAIRYYLAMILFSYGWAKIMVQQMPVPNDGRLYQRVGDMSPMGMLWTFLGSSPWYEIFCGAMEVLAAGLLFFRRTALLGAIVAAIVMFQVFVLNMCYDVPVKIYARHLLVFALAFAFIRLFYSSNDGGAARFSATNYCSLVQNSRHRFTNTISGFYRVYDFYGDGKTRTDTCKLGRTLQSCEHQ
jgi:hypothetical protein